MNLSEASVFSKCISIVVSPHIVDLKPLQTLFKSLLLLSKFVFVNYTHTEPQPPAKWLVETNMNWHKVKKPCSPRIEPSGELIRLPCAPRQLIHFHCKTTAVQRMNDFWVSSTTTATRHVQQNERLYHMNEWLCWPSDLRRWFSRQAPPVHMVCVCAAPLRRLYITAGKPTSASVNTILINNDDGSLN